MLTIFILLILEDFFDGNSLSCRPVHSKIDNPKSSLSSYSLYLISVSWKFGSLSMYAVGVGFEDLIGLSLDVLIGGEGFALSYFELLFGLIAIFEHVLRINVNIFGFGNDSFSSFELPLELGLLRHFLDFGDNPSVHLFTRVASFFERWRFFYEHRDYKYVILTHNE